ncbi:mechanosensitive ion channel family protein [Polyangium jinanense]|uniref:Mechanosensitive ion channel family protein n=1 Tax=Polyangium jinanense TaxID=2829994 RepID=A0A9X4AQT7_9BACT|nr:mechanosensitive ion channel family protein [Polyangium jinanense]MDC3954801.1 mechanosensitive ion channel family protein [Polyangium jinanense]MDC3981428.1 mechanosensitive ion channel family protein [Polyangium jinanense]
MTLHLDLLAHNLVALCITIVVLLLLSELLVRTIHRGYAFLLRSPTLEHVTADERKAFRRRVRRRAIVWVALLVAVLMAAAGFATYRGIWALDVAKSALVALAGDDPALVKTRLLTAFGIAAGALFVDALARGLAEALGQAVARSEWLDKRREPLAEVTIRLRKALRVVVLGAAAVLIADKLTLAPGTQRSIVLATYTLGAFYVSRLATGIGYLLLDVIFDNATRLANLESPLRYLGNLSHLLGITKRVVDYCVYLTAATWVADALTPDTWLSQAGRVGLRIIAIFYASRVLVEICVLLINDLFLGKVAEANPQTLQQRKTLVPVAMGFVRYAIYFSALVMGLREASIDPTPLLAGAGVIGVAIGFGAQTFVGDIVAGFFILFENLLLVGDLVEIGGIQGRVEEIGVRITKIRDDLGVLHSIPNGEVRKVANHSRSFVNAVVDVHVPYEEDLPRVRELLTSIAEQEVEARTGAPARVEVGVEELNEGSIVLRVSARVPPGENKDMNDALRGRIVDELRKAQVGAPRPRRAVLIESTLNVKNPPKREIEESAPITPFSPAQED